jgi:uncharacterized protein YuzE
MNVTYDKVADAVYIQIKKGKIEKTVEVSGIVMHDLDKKGNVLGIELLSASTQLSAKELENSAEGGIPLSVIQATPAMC